MRSTSLSSTEGLALNMMLVLENGCSPDARFGGGTFSYSPFETSTYALMSCSMGTTAKPFVFRARHGFHPVKSQCNETVDGIDRLLTI